MAKPVITFGTLFATCALLLIFGQDVLATFGQAGSFLLLAALSVGMTLLWVKAGRVPGSANPCTAESQLALQVERASCLNYPTKRNRSPSRPSCNMRWNRPNP